MKSMTGEKTFGLERALIISAEEDYADLATMVRTVQDELGLTKEESTRLATLGTIHELLSKSFLRAGIPHYGGGFEAWDEDLAATMDRIESEWRGLGRLPALGEIAWFDATDLGLSYLESSTD
jgi:hypothetical protein